MIFRLFWQKQLLYFQVPNCLQNLKKNNNCLWAGILNLQKILLLLLDSLEFVINPGTCSADADGSEWGGKGRGWNLRQWFKIYRCSFDSTPARFQFNDNNFTLRNIPELIDTGGGRPRGYGRNTSWIIDKANKR